MVGGNWLKSIFFLFLDHFPGFPNYTFLNFQKKIFSLHPNAHYQKHLILIGREKNAQVNIFETVILFYQTVFSLKKTKNSSYVVYNFLLKVVQFHIMIVLLCWKFFLDCFC